MVEIVTRPELHGETPSDEILGKTTPDEWAIREES